MDPSAFISVDCDGGSTAAGIQAAPEPAGFDAITGDGETCRVGFEIRTIIVERLVGNLTCRISIPAAFYEGVALIMGEDNYTVRLVNRDPGLTMNIGGLPDLGKALDLRDDLARQLRLPAMTVSRDGEISCEERKLGGLIVGDQGPRRGSMATRRRPRFLARRKKGHGREACRVNGREIIARD
jgi:hypothetical protein